jgi:hypothetical protein
MTGGAARSARWPQEAPTISRRETLLVAAWALGVVLLGFAPLAFAHATAPDGWSFTGFYSIGFNDYQGYMAWIRQAQDGHLLFLDKFTSEPHRRVAFHPLFWLLGALSRWTGAPVLPLWYLLQGLGLVLMVFALYRFSAEFTDSVAARRLALVLATTASGLGWLWPGEAATPVVRRPIDLWMEEANQLRTIGSSFFTLTLALALMLLAAVWMLGYFRTGRMRQAVTAGLLALLLATIHPYDMVTLYAVLAVWTLLAGRRRWAGSLAMVAISIPGLLYGFLAVELDPVLSQVRLTMEMPPASAFVIGWGLPLALALVALALPSVWRQHRHVRLLAVWVGVNLVLLLVPLEFRRKLVWGLHPVFCLLAALAIRDLALRLTSRLAERPRARWWAAAAPALAVVLLTAVGSLDFYLDQFGDRSFGRFLPAGVLEAFAALDASSGGDDVVVAGPALAGFVPGWTGATAFWGHWALTLDLPHKRDLALQMITPGSPLDRASAARLLAEHRIRWVVLDKVSAETGPAGAWPVPVERLAVAPWARPVFENEWVEILEIQR